MRHELHPENFHAYRLKNLRLREVEVIEVGEAGAGVLREADGVEADFGAHPVGSAGFESAGDGADVVSVGEAKTEFATIIENHTELESPRGEAEHEVA